jgi:uncharacterized protein
MPMLNAQATPRIAAIDTVRGFAVLGILLMNIVSQGLPGYAYISPAHAGGDTGADLAAWLVNFVAVDGKMRALFTLLFGASLLLIADGADGRVPGPAALHYRRMAWLLLIGMAHAWLVWSGDILVTYALAGALLFPARRLAPHQLFVLGGLVLAMLMLASLAAWWHFHGLQQTLADPATPVAVARDARAALATLLPAAGEAAREIAGFRGGFADAFHARAATTLLFQTVLIPQGWLWEALGIMAIGMGLYRSGFFTAAAIDRRIARLVWLLPAGAVLTVPVAMWLYATRWDPVACLAADALLAPVRIAMAIGWAALLMRLLHAGVGRAVLVRLAACGRMALSNYLGANILTTTLFNGYGFGLFGHLGRAELLGVVAAVWALQLWASPLWLRYFRYGPFEWLWRSLVRQAPQPMRIG